MIKAIARCADGKPLLILGLSRKNTELLFEGKPIPVECGPLVGVELRVILIAGETEETMAGQLGEFITGDTVVHRPDPKGGS